MTAERRGRKAPKGLIFLVLAVLCAVAAPDRVKTVVDKASLKASPEISAKSLLKLPLGSVLEVKDKQGEWYKVEFEKDGQKISGFIHEMLVEEAPTEPAVESSAGAGPGAARDPASEIESGIDGARERIRQDKDLAQAQDSLDGLLAKVFTVNDPHKQKTLAVEIYLWLGIGRVSQGQDAAALREFKKMFDVDAAAAREAIRNIATPRVDALLKLAEQQSQGLISDFGLEVESEPPGAGVIIDGREMGSTPGTFRWPSPKFILEVRKTGFVPVHEDVLLTSASEKRTYRLDLLKRDLRLSSFPPGAAVFLDGQDMGLVTDCKLTGLTFGRHDIRLTKSSYLDWSGFVEIGETQDAALQAGLVGTSYLSAGSWGGRGSGVFEGPAVLAGDAEGFLYVLDESSNRIRKLTAEGKPVTGWTVSAPELRDLKSPTAAAVDSQGTLYIADGKRGLFLKIGPDGRTASVWNGEGGGTSGFRGPSGIAFDSAGNIYVAEAGNDRVKKYSGRGQYLKAWGSQGTKDGQFMAPRGIALNGRDEVFILDKTRVQKFSADGVFLVSFGGAGKAEGQFSNPQGLALDAAGCVYVADTDDHRIEKFAADGKLIAVWGSRGREDGRLGAPIAVRVDGQGRVFVLEKENERLQVFVVGGQGSAR